MGEVLAFKTRPADTTPSAKAETVAATAEEISGISALIREVYARIIAEKSREGEARSVSEAKISAARANAEANNAPTTVLINGEFCEVAGFKEKIIELFHRGLPTVELCIPGEVALRLGNQHMEGDYDLDVFVEAAFVNLLQGYLRLDTPPIPTEATLELGPMLSNPTGTDSIREYYIIEMRNLDCKPHIVPDIHPVLT